MTKTFFILLIWVVTVPSFFSILTSIVAIFYFASMLKFNIINKYYSKSWLKYFKSFIFNENLKDEKNN